jgi:hypothetical protein
LSQPKKKDAPVKPGQKLTRAQRRQIAAAIQRAKGNTKEISAQQSIPYQRMYPTAYAG